MIKFTNIQPRDEKPEIGNSLAIKRNQRQNWDLIVLPRISTAGDKWDIETLMSYIRHIVLINRISLKPFFEDFDQLRSGRITRTQFYRCLAKAGLSRIELHPLSPAQMELLYAKGPAII
ncbi:unnamed protein product [Protopolystoma xenopodis]|uniref:EF-hand domain-containing protein n=1 Tax=Protopolystoma xenopodis TaxID=117903 RepID=A0A448XEX0_9PLAT|nr:unnamed protein product [Protopolystoma xenopodis]